MDLYQDIIEGKALLKFPHLSVPVGAFEKF